MKILFFAFNMVNRLLIFILLLIVIRTTYSQIGNVYVCEKLHDDGTIVNQGTIFYTHSLDWYFETFDNSNWEQRYIYCNIFKDGKLYDKLKGKVDPKTDGIADHIINYPSGRYIIVIYDINKKELGRSMEFEIR